MENCVVTVTNVNVKFILFFPNNLSLVKHKKSTSGMF